MRSVATTAFWKVYWVRLSTPTSITAWASMFAVLSRRIVRRRPNALCYFCTRTAPARSVGMGPSKSSSPSIDFLLGFARNANTMRTLRPATLSRRRHSSVPTGIARGDRRHLLGAQSDLSKCRENLRYISRTACDHDNVSRTSGIPTLFHRERFRSPVQHFSYRLDLSLGDVAGQIRNKIQRAAQEYLVA